jgi:predicted ATPase
MPVAFAEPDDSDGSGLTILIGENGNGKTTILEAINYLTQSKFATENKLTINDFNKYNDPIEIDADISSLICSSSIDFYKDWRFKVKGISFSAKSRTTKERGKLLSSAYEIKNKFTPESNYIKSNGEEDKEVDSRDLSFSNGQIQDDDLNIFYFDKNRTRQISTGNYKTTLDRILEDLNWRFVKGMNSANEAELLENISGAFFKQVDGILGASPGKKLGEEMSEFFNDEEYKKLRIDLLHLLHPFTAALFALRDEKSLSQRTIGSLGSGVEMILTILLLRIISSASKGTIVYLIDEPEMHLHPKAQEKLLSLLLEESRDKQVIISTHSPYMFKGVFSTKASLLICTKNNANEIEINNARKIGWGLFGKSSPTWGEINYFAYDLATVEFHNELYGHIQALAVDDDEGNYYEEAFDLYLQSKLGDQAVVLDWIKELKEKDDNGSRRTETNQRTLQTYIRNSIHHPENSLNDIYTPDELKKSTEQLINLLRGMV